MEVMKKILWDIKVQGINYDESLKTHEIEIHIGDAVIDMNLDSLNISGFDKNEVLLLSKKVTNIFENLRVMTNKKSKN